MNKFNLSLIIITISVFLVTACIDELEDDPIPNPYESYLIIDDNVKNEESVENVVKNNEGTKNAKETLELLYEATAICDIEKMEEYSNIIEIYGNLITTLNSMEGAEQIDTSHEAIKKLLTEECSKSHPHGEYKYEIISLDIIDENTTYIKVKEYDYDEGHEGWDEYNHKVIKQNNSWKVIME